MLSVKQEAGRRSPATAWLSEQEDRDSRSHISGAGCLGDFPRGPKGPNAAGGCVYLQRGGREGD